MAVTHVKVGAVKNNGGTILGANNADPSLVNDLKITDTLNQDIGNKVILAVSPTESGNIGTAKVIQDGVFLNTNDKYISPLITDKVAGKSSNILSSPGVKQIYSTLNYGRGSERLDIQSWDYVTGKATYGPNKGDHFGYWAPLDEQSINVEQFPTDLVPGEFTYKHAPLMPIMADYPSRT